MICEASLLSKSEFCGILTLTGQPNFPLHQWDLVRKRSCHSTFPAAGNVTGGVRNLLSSPDIFLWQQRGKKLMPDFSSVLSSAVMWGKILRSAPGFMCCDSVGCSLYTDGLANESTLLNRVLNQGY